MPAMRDFFQRRGKFRPEQADEERADLQIPEDLWIKCPSCGELIYSRELERSSQVCPKCSYHFRLRARERIAQLSDPGSFTELHADIRPEDPLNFVDGAGSYDQKLRADPEQVRRAGGPCRRRGHDRRRAGDTGRQRLRVPGRQHGFGLRREARSRCRIGRRPPGAAAHGVLVRRRAHA